MELKEAIQKLAESMRSINAKLDNRYLSIEFVLFEQNDFKISAYAGKCGTSFNDRYDLNKGDVDITESSLIEGLERGFNRIKERINLEIKEHEEAVDKLKEKIKELDAAMEKEDKNEQ